MDPVDGVRSYVEAAAGRPEWLLWGKAQPDERAQSPAHPLLCHMVDVAVVAEAMLRDVLPASTRARLIEPLGRSEADSLAWLAFIVAMHDIGKATPPFQTKWAPAHELLMHAGFDVRPPSDGRDHAKLGVSLARNAFVELGIEESFAHQLARSVAAHHGTFPTDRDAGRPLVGPEAGKSPRWRESRRAIVRCLAEAFGVPDRPPPVQMHACDWAFASVLAGFTSVADWVGSMAEVFRYQLPPGCLREYLPVARQRASEALGLAGFRPTKPVEARTFDALFGFSPRPLQASIARILDRSSPPMCIVVEAPMGEGKTEAALYVSHALDARKIHDGTYLGLPTQATANQMFNRLSEFLSRTRPDQRINLQLLHGEAIFDARVRDLLRAVYGPGESLVCEPWFLGKKRALLAPFGAGTVDQALLAVLRTKHAFVRQLGLAGKTVILDEVHAYDAYTSTLLERLVSWLGALGATVVLLSATLPSARRRGLLEAYAGKPLGQLDAAPYPRVSWADASGAHATGVEAGRAGLDARVEWLDDSMDAVVDLALALATEGGNVGILRNTVSRAQETMKRVRQAEAEHRLSSDVALLLLHARFPAEDRRRLEEDLISALGKTGSRPRGMIVIGTQVLEQSLDIDFDALLTDLAPVDLLLQRAGRLHRHARPPRPGRTREPALWIIVPIGDPKVVPLGSVARVYEPYVVRRTLLTLASRPKIRLPDDIEPLVEAVYSDDEPAAWSDALRVEREEMHAARTEDELRAMARVWPPPSTPDDPFGSLEMPFEADDPDVAKMLRAETRLGEPTAEIVCLFGDPSHAFFDRARTRPADLDEVPSRDLVRAFALRTVRVATRGLVQAIPALPIPPTWKDVSLLERRRPVFFGDNPVTITRFRIQLDDELGLIVDREKDSQDAVFAYV